jgi:ornithine cyclodeaminase/alanine dehydrogenase-like protein (mu-crystallin family)
VRSCPPEIGADHILYLSRSQVARALEGVDHVAVVASALAAHARGETVLSDAAYLSWENRRGEPARSLSMPAVVDGCVGVKVINANRANPDRGLPRASGLTLLFDPETARPICVMEGAWISCLRTAAVTALATELLASAPVERVALLGAGTIAACHLELFHRRFPALREIRLFDLRHERAAALALTWAAGRWPVTVSPSAEEAIRGSELVVPVTTATYDYIPYAWLERGALLVNVSLDDPRPEVVLRADRVFVDDWGLVAADGRRLLGRMLREGLVTGPDDPGRSAPGPRGIDGGLGDVLIGAHEGRTHPDEIILVNPFGLALEDVAVAQCAYEHALELGLGTPIER